MRGVEANRTLFGVTLEHSRIVVALRLTSLLAAIALLSGCGGPSSEERYAERACSTALVRAQEMTRIFDDVRHTRATPGAEGRRSLLVLIAQGKEVATTLGDDLRALPVPNTAASQMASTYFEDVARSAFGILAAEERRVRRLGENMTLVESIRALNHLEVVFAIAYIKMTDYGVLGTEFAEFQEPLENADSCKELRALQPPS